MSQCKVCYGDANPFGGWFEEEFVKQYGICEKCFIKSKGLVKSGNHYVPWIYRYATHIPQYNSGKNYLKIKSKHYTDVNSVLPKISWCSKTKKWKIEFVAEIFVVTPTVLGNNSEWKILDLVWYFDTEKDIISNMERIPYNKLIREDSHYVFQEAKDTEDVNKPLSKISRCPRHKKWKIEFISADKEGKGVSRIEWYFDNKEDILKSMKKEE